MYQEEIKIPKDRVPILIGKKGTVKKGLQFALKIRLEINDDGIILIKSTDSLNIYIAKQVLKAIGRGFNPDIAIQLQDEINSLEVLNIDDYSKKNKNRQFSIKSRLIGTNGKSRRIIERLTNTHIQIYGKTASIIGEVSNVNLARQALDRLMQGAKHGNVYAFIEKKKQSFNKS